MFIRIQSTNYFVIPDGKSPKQIVDEIITRMNKSFIPKQERIEIHKIVLEHLHNR